MVPERAAVMQAMLRGPQTTGGWASGCHAPKHASTHTSVATTAAASRREVLSLALLASTCVAKRAVASDSPAPSSCAGGTDTQLARGGAAYDAFADSYDDLNDGAVADAFGLPALRRELLARARGDVLEIGVGTGINLGLYRFGVSEVTSLTAVDLSAGMLAAARQRASGLRLCEGGGSGRVTFTQADATKLPFADSSFDSCVDTFSLCVLGAAAPAAVAELARVLRPGGRVLLLEHTRSDFAPLAAYQDMTASAVAASSKGCAWNQDVLAMLQPAGLRLVRATSALGGLVTCIEANRDEA